MWLFRIIRMVRVHARRHEQSRCDWDHSVDSGLFLLCRFPRKPDRSPALRSDDGVSGNGELQPLSGSPLRSEEHTSELQSLMRISYAVFCLNKKNTYKHNADQ